MVVLNLVTGVLVKSGHIGTLRRRPHDGDDGGRDQSDAPMSQGCQEPPEAGRDQKRSSPRALGGMRPCPDLDLRSLVSRTVTE